MSLMSKVGQFARGPQGRKLMSRAQDYASSPEGRRKIAQIRQRMAKRRA